MTTSSLARFGYDKSAIAQIIDGSVAINAIELMLDILNKFPTEPNLLRIYADLCLKNKMHDAAARAYDKAVKLFIDKGKMLPALVSKISQWQIVMPSDQQVYRFLSKLKSSSDKEPPLNQFFSKLSIQELQAVSSLFEKIRLPAGEVVKKVGDREDHLFFIVSGQLKDSIYLALQNKRKVFRKPTLILADNDFFGSIYPFDKAQRSQSYIETLDPVELVAISKEKLMRICCKYPNIELGVIELLKMRSFSGSEESLDEVRKETRHKSNLRLTLEIYPKNSTDRVINLQSDSTEISVGGMSLVIDPIAAGKSFDISALYQTISNAKIRIDVLIGMLSLKVSGRIVWRREVIHNGIKTLAMGMQFDKMSPRIRGLIFALLNSLD